MSLTQAGALKAFLEAPGQNLGIAFYKDAPPSSVKPPTVDPYTAYGIIIENIGLKLDPLEDGGTAPTIVAGVAIPSTAKGTGRELVQLDLWQCWRVKDKDFESPTLADAITHAVHGARLPMAPKLVYGILQTGRVRHLDRDANLVHHMYTLAFAREV